ncbi:MAG: sodium-dependent transporter [Alphaproteobacteria bacterium]
MQPAASSHAHWSSRFAFIMAAVGSAVGLGNFWRFPYQAGENGGGAFVLVYVAAVVLIAIPVLFAELMIGRRTGVNAVGSTQAVAKESGGSGVWGIAGGVGMLSAFLILSFYSVIAGWVMAYIPKAASGALMGLDGDQVAQVFTELTENPLQVIIWHTIFMGITVFIVARGLLGGIELAAKILMPLFFLMLLVMVGYSAYIGTQDCGAGQVCGLERAFDFLFTVDWNKITPASTLAAIGQAFFSVGIGVAIMLTYGAYLNKESNIPANGVLIAFSDTLVAILAGLAIFPIVFATGQDPAAGPGLLFVTLPYSLGQMPAGELIGTMFFTLAFFAALTSSISMLEIMTSWAEEHRGFRRLLGAITGGFLAWLVGLGTVFSFSGWKDFHPFSFIPALKDATVFDSLDYLTGNFTMPVGGLLIALLAGWVVRRQIVSEELRLPGIVLLVWRILLQFFVPAALIFLLLTGLGIIQLTETGLCADFGFAKGCAAIWG